MRRVRVFAGLAVLTAVVVSACTPSPSGGTGQSEDQAVAGELPTVVVSSYPLAYLAQRVAGNSGQVEDLSAEAGDAHHFELSPMQVQKVASADVVLYLADGLQPAMEEAAQSATGIVLDGMSILSEDELIPGDPHIWMDPLIAANLADAIAGVLGEANPDAADVYEQNAGEVRADLEEVDSQYRAALVDCAGQTLLTTHEAFGYLVRQYGLEQVGVLGVDPESEPSPARIQEVKGIVAERGIEALFVEPAASHHHSDAFAETIGLPTWELDTLETQLDPDNDFLDVFGLNLESLQSGLPCAASVGE